MQHLQADLFGVPNAEEASDEIILRMVELDGKNTSDVHVSFAGPIVAAREVNAQEQPIGPADMTNGELKTSFTAYQPRTFALRLNSAPTKLSSINSQPISKTRGYARALPRLVTGFSLSCLHRESYRNKKVAGEKMKNEFIAQSDGAGSGSEVRSAKYRIEELR